MRLVEALNDEHAHGGSRTGDWSWKASPEFYASCHAFQFEQPSLVKLLEARMPEFAALALWLMATTGLLILSAQRLERGVNP